MWLLDRLLGNDLGLASTVDDQLEHDQLQRLSKLNYFVVRSRA